MLGEGLAREYPSVAATIRRLRRPSVAREPWIWAALSGLGASAVTSLLLQLPLISVRSVALTVPYLGGAAAAVVAIAAVAVGLAVAWRAGGARAAALFIAVYVAYALAGVPSALVFCERNGAPNCLASLLGRQWQTLAGFVVAIPLARSVHTGAERANPTLSAMGAYVTAQRLLFLPAAFIAFTARNAESPDPSDMIVQVLYLSIVAVAAAAICGEVLAIRRAMTIGILVPIAAIAVSWGQQSWLMMTFEQQPPWSAITLATGPVAILALVLAKVLRPRGTPTPLAGPS